MATRFFFPTTGTPSLTPTYDALWDDTASADRMEMVTAKISSAFANSTAVETIASQCQVLWRQYLSAQQWQAYSFSGTDTWKLQARCMETSALQNSQLYIIAKVVQSDGSIRGTLISASIQGSEFIKTTYTNRGMSGVCQTISMQDTDHIMIEVGYDANNTKSTAYTSGAEFGDNSGTDLPEDDASTSQYCPWFELSPDLSEYGAAPPISLVGSVAGASGVPDKPLKRLRNYIGAVVAAAGVVALATLGVTTHLHGRCANNLLLDPSLEQWTTSTDLTQWGESLSGGVVSRETTEVDHAYKSCKMTAPGAGTSSAINQTIALGADVRVYLRFRLQADEDSAVGYFTIRDSANNIYLQADGSWAAGYNQTNFSNPAYPVFGSLDYEFTTDPSYSSYRANFYTTRDDISAYYDLIEWGPANSQITGDLTVGAGGAVEAMAGAVASESNIPDRNLKRAREYIGSALSESGIADTTLKRVRELSGSVVSASGIADVNIKRERGVRPTDEVADGGLENWATATDLTHWVETPTGASTLNRDNTEQRSGEYCARFDIDASQNDVTLAQDITLDPNKSYKLTVWGKTDDAGKAAYGYLRVIGEDYWLNPSGEWTTSTWTSFGGYSDSPYLERTRIFVPVAGKTDYKIFVLNGSHASYSVYVDDARVNETVGGISSVAGDLTVSAGAVEALAGTVTAASNVPDVNLKRLREIAGETISISSADAGLSVSLSLQGIATAGGAVDAALSRDREFIGEIVAGVSDITGTLTLDREFIGETVEGISAISGAITTAADKSLAGAVAAISGIDGDLTGAFTLAGAVDSESSTTGALSANKALIGAVNSISTVEADLGPLRGLIGETVQGQSSITGALYKTAEKPLAGAVVAASNIPDVNLERNLGLIVAIAGASNITGRAEVDYTLAGNVAGESTIGGDLSIRGKVLLAGSSGAVSGASGSAAIEWALSGAFDAQAGSEALISVLYGLSGTASGVSDITGSMGGAIPLSGDVAGISNITGGLSSDFGLIGAVGASSGVTGSLKRVRSFVGSITAITGADGSTKLIRGAAGSVAASSGTSAGAGVAYSIAGATAASSGVAGALTVTLLTPEGFAFLDIKGYIQPALSIGAYISPALTATGYKQENLSFKGYLK